MKKRLRKKLRRGEFTEGALHAALAARIPPTTLRRVRAEHLTLVLQELDGFLAPTRAAKWLVGANAHLGDRSPLFMLIHGEVDAVLRTLQTQKAGSFA